MASLRGVMHCLCAACGKPERVGGDLRGWSCQCDHSGTCMRCFRCGRCCECAAGFVSREDWHAMTTEQKVALATEGKALREELKRWGKIYR